jgi:hypothetical protein
MTIVLILNVVFSAAVVMAIVGLLTWNIAVDHLSPAGRGPDTSGDKGHPHKPPSFPLRWSSS